ncbi:MAG: purine-binding chemotaxis protein CheW [Rhodobiaceae bacterium]|nr:purine-binding chemotaxis protein CheW [Rhodobiaceae bacterium]MCC0057438.1 purine-binding chemotaxis protein CheW [Rhodobiaceae bacterium]
MSATITKVSGESREYVTVKIAGQLFGLAIDRIHDVFAPVNMTPVPLAQREIAGVLNLRGRIVTAIDMRRRLGLPDRDDAGTSMAVGIDANGESFGLIVDNVGEVMRLALAELESAPANLDKTWSGLAAGIYRLEGQLLVILDVDRVLRLGGEASAAA